MEYLSLGKITGSFGLDGSIKVYSTTNLASLRYKKGSKVFLVNPEDDSKIEATVLNYKKSGNFDIVTLDIISNVDDAISKKGYELQVEKNNLDLEPGSYFYSDLRGCEVFDNLQNKLGIVKEIEEFPAQITLRVSRGKLPDFFVPFIKEFICEVDIENKRIIINVIKGLL